MKKADFKLQMVVWLLSLGIASATIFVLRNMSDVILELPSGLRYESSNVFIGSSLTRSGILASPIAGGSTEVSGPAAKNALLTIAGISEVETLMLFEHATEFKPAVVFIEVNGLVTDIRGIDGVPIASNFAEWWVRLQEHMALSIKSRLGLPTENQHVVRQVETEPVTLMGTHVTGRPPYIFPRSARYLEEFVETTLKARANGIRTFFFWPPQFASEYPELQSHFLDLRSHIVAICRRMKANCWVPQAPWNERFFYDELGHLNRDGAHRLTAELLTWAEER